MNARLGLVLCVLAVLPGCTAVLNFNQCTMDEDCQRLASGGGPAYCTADHICVSDFPDDRICALDVVSSTRTDSVTLAGLFRLSGPTEVRDTELARAAELAVDEVNQAGKRGLRLVLCDTGGDPERARKALSRAVSGYGAIATVGPTSSAEVLALARDGDSLVSRYGVLVVSSSATAPALTALADEGLVWRTAPSDAIQARVLAGLVPTATARVATAYVSSTYGTAFNGAFSTALDPLFVPPLIPDSRPFPEGSAGSEVATFLSSSNPQVALLVAQADAPAWVLALLGGGSGLATTEFLLTDGARTQALLDSPLSASLFGRLSGTAPAAPSGPSYNAFQAAFMAAYGSNPSSTPFVANAYDATYAIAIAMGAIPSGSRLTGRVVAEAMKRLSDPAGMSYRVGASDFAAAYQSLAEGGVVNLQGSSGPIDFDAGTGDVLTAPIEVWGIDTSKSPPGFATKRIVTP